MKKKKKNKLHNKFCYRRSLNDNGTSILYHVYLRVKATRPIFSVTFQLAGQRERWREWGDGIDNSIIWTINRHTFISFALTAINWDVHIFGAKPTKQFRYNENRIKTRERVKERERMRKKCISRAQISRVINYWNESAWCGKWSLFFFIDAIMQTDEINEMKQM